MARYRLRFLLQEFDLPRGTTLIGRSSECQVTIEDPLVSRQHARILIDGDEAGRSAPRAGRGRRSARRAAGAGERQMSPRWLKSAWPALC